MWNTGLSVYRWIELNETRFQKGRLIEILNRVHMHTRTHNQLCPFGNYLCSHGHIDFRACSFSLSLALSLSTNFGRLSKYPRRPLCVCVWKECLDKCGSHTKQRKVTPLNVKQGKLFYRKLVKKNWESVWMNETNITILVLQAEGPGHYQHLYIWSHWWKRMIYVKWTKSRTVQKSTSILSCCSR